MECVKDLLYFLSGENSRSTNMWFSEKIDLRVRPERNQTH
jgi:hypothetical protein